MAWKPKERELTEEEAVDQARKELKPRWLHADPLFTVLYEGEGQDERTLGEPKLFPLDKSFRARRWLLFFFDPTSYVDRAFHTHLKDLVRRYGQQGLTPLVVLAGRPPFLLDLPQQIHFLRSLKAEWALVSDVEARIAKAFGLTQFPAVVLMDRGVLALQAVGPQELPGFEERLQAYLWKLEPGLPMYPALPTSGVLREELFRLDFDPQGVGPLKFSRPPGELIDGGYLISDPTLTVSFESPGPEVGFVFAPQSPEEVAHAVVESEGMPIYDSYHGEELRMDDEGRTGFVINEAKLYRATRGLPDSFRKLVIRFPGADKMPLRWYGVRVARAIQAKP